MIANCLARGIFVTSVSLVWTAFVSIVASGATYYVATNGNNANPGTEAQPWKTIQKAADTATAGDTVYIKAGIYKEKVAPRNSGNIDNYITYMAHGSGEVTIDGTGLSLPRWGGLFDILRRDYIRVSGLRIVNSVSAGIFVNHASHIIIEKNYTYNSFTSGIGAWNSDNIVIDDNEVELACNDGDQECITVAATDRFEIKNNHVHHGGPGTTGGEGINAKEGSANGKIYRNRVHDLPNRHGMYVDAWDRHTYNIEVFDNIVHDCPDGLSVAAEAGGLLENVVIYNNIVYNSRFVGITIADWGKPILEHPMKDIKVINNTFYDNGRGDWGGGISVENPNVENVVIRNNICSQNLSFQIAVVTDVRAESLTIDYNLIDGYRGYHEELRGSDCVEGNPLFINTRWADFHLEENSPAIDKGSSFDAPGNDLDGNYRPQGAGYDIGAFEFMATDINRPSNDEPLVIDLFQSYPNPFSNTTTIEYLILESGHVELKVYSLSGELIRTLIDEQQQAGSYMIEWNGRNNEGEHVSSGIYFYCLKVGAWTEVRKCAVSK